MRHVTLAALLSAVLLAGCGGDDTAQQDASTATTKTTAASATPQSASQSMSAATDTIRISEFLFDPTPATVRAGQKIAVVNDDKAPHTLTDQPASGKRMFDTGNITGNQSGSFVAPKVGTYAYFCELHAFMKGELTVVP